MFTHDAAVVAVTVYNVVVTGVTVGEPLMLPGFHRYVVPATELVALNVDDFPRQIDDGVDVGVITGIGLTVTNIVAEFEQPPLVAETVYVVVLVGFAVTLEPVVDDKPVAGVQVYDVAALVAVNTVLPPGHIEALGETVNAKLFDAVTITCPVPEQPLRLPETV